MACFVSDVMKRNSSQSDVQTLNSQAVAETGHSSAPAHPKIHRTAHGASSQKHKLDARPSPSGDTAKPAVVKTPSSLGTPSDVTPHSINRTTGCLSTSQRTSATTKPGKNDPSQLCASSSLSAKSPSKRSKNDIVSQPTTTSCGVKPQPGFLRYGWASSSPHPEPSTKAKLGKGGFSASCSGVKPLPNLSSRPITSSSRIKPMPGSLRYGWASSSPQSSTDAKPGKNDFSRPSASSSGVKPPPQLSSQITSGSLGVRLSVSDPKCFSCGRASESVPNASRHCPKLQPHSEQVTAESNGGRIQYANCVISPSSVRNSGCPPNSKTASKCAAGGLNTQVTASTNWTKNVGDTQTALNTQRTAGSGSPKNIGGIPKAGAIIASAPVYYTNSRPKLTAVRPLRMKHQKHSSSTDSNAAASKFDAAAKAVPYSAESQNKKDKNNKSKRKLERQLENENAAAGEASAPKSQRVAGWSRIKCFGFGVEKVTHVTGHSWSLK